MKTNLIKKGFTLIELLVVITIIGILATGGISVYTTQIQKARDSNRITDVQSILGAVEQANQDNGQYPLSTEFASGSTSKTGINDYIKIPTDPKFGEACYSSQICGYIYGVSSDSNTILYGEFEISTAFENVGNIKGKAAAAKDEGEDDTRWEMGINVGDTTKHVTKSTITTFSPTTSFGCNSIADGTSTPASGVTSIFVGKGC